MPYTTHDEIRGLLGDPSEDTLATAVITRYLRKNSAYIDGMLAHLYPVPFNPVPELIKSWAEDLTCYAILKSPGFRIEKPVDTAMIEVSRDTAVMQIKDAARKKMRLPELTARDLTGSTTDTIERTFGVDNPLEWQIDPDLLRKVESTRRKS